MENKKRIKRYKNNFTQTNIREISRMFGYSYIIVDKNTILIELVKNQYIKLQINRKDDSIIINEKEIYIANKDRKLFNLFPREDIIRKYKDTYNPFCNIYYLFKHIEKKL